MKLVLFAVPWLRCHLFLTCAVEEPGQRGSGINLFLSGTANRQEQSSWGMASLELVQSTADKSRVLQTSTIILKWLWRSRPSWDILGLKVIWKEKYQNIRTDSSFHSRKLEFLRYGQAGYLCDTDHNCIFTVKNAINLLSLLPSSSYSSFAKVLLTKLFCCKLYKKCNLKVSIERLRGEQAVAQRRKWFIDNFCVKQGPSWFIADFSSAQLCLLLWDRPGLIARQAAFFSSTRIKIKLRHLTCDVKLGIVIAVKASGCEFREESWSCKGSMVSSVCFKPCEGAQRLSS